MDIEWRSLTASEIVDICDAGRAELQRRRDEAEASLELAFGPREIEPDAPRRGRKPKDVSGLSARQQQLAEAGAES